MAVSWGGRRSWSPQPQIQDTPENASCVSHHEERKHLQGCGHELAPITAATFTATAGSGGVPGNTQGKGPPRFSHSLVLQLEGTLDIT